MKLQFDTSSLMFVGLAICTIATQPSDGSEPQANGAVFSEPGVPLVSGSLDESLSTKPQDAKSTSSVGSTSWKIILNDNPANQTDNQTSQIVPSKTAEKAPDCDGTGCGLGNPSDTIRGIERTPRGQTPVLAGPLSLLALGGIIWAIRAMRSGVKKNAAL